MAPPQGAYDPKDLESKWDSLVLRPVWMARDGRGSSERGLQGVMLGGPMVGFSELLPFLHPRLFR